MTRFPGLPTAHLVVAALLLIAAPITPRVIASASDDALARPEFDKELSLDMKGVDVTSAFRMISKVTSVPFVIDFESDPGLRLTFKAENMVSRGVLASLAGTYGLSFSTSDEGVVVRRPGFPSAAKKATLGAWRPARPDSAAYRLEFVIRHPGGATNFSGAFNLRKGMVGRVTIDAKGNGGVEVSDRVRGIAEPRWSGGTELRVSVQGESKGGLDLLTELVTSRPLTTDSYEEDHLVRNLRGVPGETLLAQTTAGSQVLLSRWTKIGNP